MLVSFVAIKQRSHIDQTGSVVENTVAIVVGCMPAFAKFSRLYIANLTPIRLLRSKIWGSSSYGSSNTQGPPPNGTFGSPKPKQGAQYYELTESTLTQTQIYSPQGDPHGKAVTSSGEPGILRTVSFTQQSWPENKAQSVDQLL
jgi:hypothetical protein